MSSKHFILFIKASHKDIQIQGEIYSTSWLEELQSHNIGVWTQGVLSASSAYNLTQRLGFPDGSVGKKCACNAVDTEDTGSVPGSRRSPRGGNSNPLQYSCLENPTDREAWLATVHAATKSWTQLSN